MVVFVALLCSYQYPLVYFRYFSFVLYLELSVLSSRRDIVEFHYCTTTDHTWHRETRPWLEHCRDDRHGEDHCLHGWLVLLFYLVCSCCNGNSSSWSISSSLDRIVLFVSSFCVPRSISSISFESCTKRHHRTWCNLEDEEYHRQHHPQDDCPPFSYHCPHHQVREHGCCDGYFVWA